MALTVQIGSIRKKRFEMFKRLFVWLTIYIFVLGVASTSFAAVTKMYGRDTLTGGTKSLDNIPWADLVDGYLCITITSAKVLYFHRYEDSSAAAESSPLIIKPDDAGANNGRWELVTMITAGTSTYGICWDTDGRLIDCAGVPYVVGGTDVADADMSDDHSHAALNLNVLTAAPASPVAGEIYLADNVLWDPCTVPGTVNYYCIYDGASYVAIVDEDGVLFINSISLPSYTHFATGDAVYNDTSTPHVLTEAECKNSIITNAGATEDRVYTFPAAFFGANGMGQVIAAFQMDFEPPSGEAFWLNGTQMAADEHIQNTADTKGDVISFWSVESGDGTYEYFFKSDNANWAEETP